MPYSKNRQSNPGFKMRECMFTSQDAVHFFHLCPSIPSSFNLCIEDEMLHNLLLTSLFLLYFWQEVRVEVAHTSLKSFSPLLGRSLFALLTTEKYIYWVGLDKNLWLCQCVGCWPSTVRTFLFCFPEWQTLAETILAHCDKW